MNWYKPKRKLTEEDFQKIQNELHITFPEDFKHLMAPIHGARLRTAYVRVDGVGKVSYDRNIPLIQGEVANIYDIYGLIGNLIPIAGTGFGDYFCYDPDTWKIVLYMHETNNVISVCDSFEELLNMISF